MEIRECCVIKDVASAFSRVNIVRQVCPGYAVIIIMIIGLRTMIFMILKWFHFVSGVDNVHRRRQRQRQRNQCEMSIGRYGGLRHGFYQITMAFDLCGFSVHRSYVARFMKKCRQLPKYKCCSHMPSIFIHLCAARPTEAPLSVVIE